MEENQILSAAVAELETKQEEMREAYAMVAQVRRVGQGVSGGEGIAWQGTSRPPSPQVTPRRGGGSERWQEWEEERGENDRMHGVSEGLAVELAETRAAHARLQC